MRRAAISAIMALAVCPIGPTHAIDQVQLPWRLSDYPSGGPALAGMVAGTLVRQGDLTVATCNALKPGTVQQIASGVIGVGESIAISQPDNAALIVDRLPQCCAAFASLDVDTRITVGAAIALETRQLGEADIRSAQEVEFVVGMCDDDILQRSYELARGQDNLGQLIAQEGSTPNTPLNLSTNPVISGGGVPSPS